MLTFTRDITKTFLSTFGYELSKKPHSNEILDFRGLNIDPIESFYRSQGRPYLMEIPVEKCFSIDFSGADANNPFVQTLLAYKNGLCSSYHNSPLKDFYDRWQPHTSAVTGLAKEIAPPWDYGEKRRGNLSEARLNRNDFIKIRKELGINDSSIKGHISRGPVSDGFGEVTFKRLVKLYESIEKYGYNPESMNSKHITASFFIDKNDYRVSISSGKHRVTALQALGYKKILIQFGPPKFPVLIRRDDVDSWPNVRAGYYTKEEALRLFDKKFMASHPSQWQWCGS